MTEGTRHLTVDERDALAAFARIRPRIVGGVTHIRLTGTPAAMVFVGVVLAALFVSMFAYPIAAGALSPRPVPALAIVVVVAVTGGVATALAVRQHLRARAGFHDLLIDDHAHALSLPLTFGRVEPLALPFESISGFVPALESPQTPNARSGSMRFEKRRIVPEHELPTVGHRGELRYAVLVCWTDADGESRETPVVAWTELRRANAFAAWLTARIIGV